MDAWRPLAATAIAAGIAIACASTPPPGDAIGKAEEAISRARAHDADQHAPLALRKAEDKLREAQEDARGDGDDDYMKSRRLAEQAQVDAQLALTESERAQAEIAVKELSRTVRAVEEEIQHESR